MFAGGPRVAGGPFQWNYTYANETRAAMAAFTTPPMGTRAQLYDALIRGLISDGVWPLLRGLYLNAAETEQANRVNLMVPTEVATNSGTVGFTVDRGVTSASATGHIDTGILASAFATTNNAMIGAYENVNAAEDAASIGITGATNALRIHSRSTADTVNIRVNDSTSSTFAGITDSRGLTVAQRTASNARAVYRIGVLFASDAAASTSVPAGNMAILRNNSVYPVNRRVAASMFGTALTAPQNAALNNRLVTFLTAIGAN